MLNLNPSKNLKMSLLKNLPKLMINHINKWKIKIYRLINKLRKSIQFKKNFQNFQLLHIYIL